MPCALKRCIFGIFLYFLVGWLKRNNQRFSKQKWDGNRMAILTKLWADVPFLTRLHEVDLVMLSMQELKLA